MTPTQLSVTIFDLPRYTKVCLNGRLDSDTAPNFERQVRDILSAGLVPVNQIFASIEELDAYLDKMQTQNS